MWLLSIWIVDSAIFNLLLIILNNHMLIMASELDSFVWGIMWALKQELR